MERASRRSKAEEPSARLPIDPDLDPVDPSEPAPGHHPVAADATPPRRSDPKVLVAIAVGGAAGAPARYAVAEWLDSSASAFPWATFWTNVSGAFILGTLLVVLLRRYPPQRYLRPFAATGFLGAYTTFSTFVVETDQLLDHGHAGTALTYVVASLAVGLAAAAVGMATGRLLARPAVAS